jgi:predicted anti-sigma-YlaC factor YlaD
VDNPRPPHNDHRTSEFDASIDEVTCQEFVEIVTDYFEGALDARTLAQVEEHLVMCDWCVAYVDQMETTISALRHLSDPAPPEPPARALAALRAKRSA